jgi:hypothetical protein
MKSTSVGIVLITCGTLCVLGALGGYLYLQHLLFQAQPDPAAGRGAGRDAVGFREMIIFMVMVAGFVTGGIGIIVAVWGSRKNPN